MKKRKNFWGISSLFICLLWALFSFTACAPNNDTGGTEQLAVTPESGATSAIEKNDTPSPEPTQHLLIRWPSEKTTHEEWDAMVIDQGNRHGLNSFCYDNSWIYGSWGGNDGAGEVVKVRYDNSDWTVIDSDTNKSLASCQAVKNGYIYYSQEINSGAFELIKVRSSGEGAKVIIDKHHGSIQIVDNYIYYTTPEFWNSDSTAVTKESAHLYRCDLNGENVEAILETPVYYFTVFDDCILYQDDKDNMTLHVYDMGSRENTRINNQRSFHPIYDGNHVYYMSDSFSSEEYQHKLWRMSVDGTTNEEIDLGGYLGGLLLRGDYIYYINTDDNSRIYRCLKDGSEIELVTQRGNVSSFQWVNDCLAYITKNDKGYITGVFLCEADGADEIIFCKSDDYWRLG